MGLQHDDDRRDAAVKLYTAGMAQETIAKTLGVAQSSVSRWCAEADAEGARRRRGMTALERLRDAAPPSPELQAKLSKAMNPEAPDYWEA